MSYDYQMNERGSRRRRLAEMANNVYRAGVAAASEIRDQYNTSRTMRDSDGSGSEWEEDRPPNIPGAFPDVSFATGGDAQMVLFPMYAKRHVRRYQAPETAPGGGGYSSDDPGRPGEAPDWHHEFARLEDEKAVADVNVHGWLYIVSQGPLTRKNRLLIGLARRLSGVPAPEQTSLSADATGMPAGSEGLAKDSEAQKIQRAAEAIERRGQGEKDAAARGEYSETPDQAARYDDSSSDDGHTHAWRPPPPAPGPGRLTPKSSWAASPTPGAGAATAAAPEMTEAEMIAANTNLLSRLGPFLTTPVVQQPVTLFFYNEEQSQSRTVLTTDSGHFLTCAALDFVPTHVRVLVASNSGNGGYSTRGGGAGVGSYASETALVSSLTHPLSAVAPIQLLEDRGVSLISDIDDTIKTSNIALGTREIFRNTFVRDLADMTVEGTREWYTSLHDLGVQFHYCSNSPWQLFPVLTTFFKRAGLPTGPLHLKQYSGMLQGIFEPVAERKRGTLEKIMRDFPNRRFLLVGDSGEADLEVYTELALAHPGRILAIFIRDVTTPEQPGYFDTLAASRTLAPSAGASSPGPERRPGLPAQTATARPRQQQEQSAQTEGPVMGTLIDLDDDADTNDASGNAPPAVSSSAPAGQVPALPARKPLPPPRPAKPLALRGSMAATAAASSAAAAVSSAAYTAAAAASAAAGTAATAAASALSSARSTPPPPPPPPPPRRRAVASTSTTPAGDADTGGPPPPPPRRPQATNLDGSSRGADTGRQQRQQYPYQRSPLASPQPPPPQQQPPNKKVEMWHRRLAHAQDLLLPHGVALYTWRRGQDVAAEAVAIVKRSMRRE